MDYRCSHHLLLDNELSEAKSGHNAWPRILLNSLEFFTELKALPALPFYKDITRFTKKTIFMFFLLFILRSILLYFFWQDGEVSFHRLPVVCRIVSQFLPGITMLSPKFFDLNGENFLTHLWFIIVFSLFNSHTEIQPLRGRVGYFPTLLLSLCSH